MDVVSVALLSRPLVFRQVLHCLTCEQFDVSIIAQVIHGVDEFAHSWEQVYVVSDLVHLIIL